MLDKRCVAAFAISLVVMPTVTFAADAPAMAVNPIQCVAPGMNSMVTAQIDPALTSPKVYFKTTGPEYYVDMHRGSDGNYSATLPQIEPSTSSFAYRVVADSAGHALSSLPMAVTASSSCPTMSMPADAQRYASNIVLGLTADGQPAVPVGFSCRGVVSVITATNQLRANDECRRVLAAGPMGAGAAAGSTGAGTAAAAGGFGAGAMGAAAVVAVAAGAVIIHNHHKNHHNPSPITP